MSHGELLERPPDPVLRRRHGQGRPVDRFALDGERASASAVESPVERDAAACRRGIEILHSFGIRTFQDAAASPPMLRALQHLDDSGRLDAWVVTSLQINDKIFGTDPVGQDLLDLRAPYRSTHHRPDFVKIFLDGVPTSKTAAFLEPYLPDDEHGANWRGSTTMTADELTGWLTSVAAQGLGAKIHCTGDGSVRMVLDAVAAVHAAGHTDTAFHIAHGQYVADDDLHRLVELQVTADFSPPLWFPGVILEAICACIPRDRAEHLHPNRTLLDLGVLIAGGSDWPVMPPPTPGTASRASSRVQTPPAWPLARSGRSRRSAWPRPCTRTASDRRAPWAPTT
jgi:predicted amidohydrolase YtcJ